MEDKIRVLVVDDSAAMPQQDLRGNERAGAGGSAATALRAARRPSTACGKAATTCSF